MISRPAKIASITALCVLAVILLALPVILRLRQQSASTVTDSGAIAPTPIHPMTGGAGGERVLKTVSETATFYWLYGRVVSVDQVAQDGIHMTFALDGDPYSTRLSVLLTPVSGTYRLREYESAYGGKMMERKLNTEAMSEVLLSAKEIELRLPFRRLKPEEETTMTALEGPNTGNWKSLPVGQTLMAETIGLIKTP